MGIIKSQNSSVVPVVKGKAITDAMRYVFVWFNPPCFKFIPMAIILPKNHSIHIE